MMQANSQLAALCTTQTHTMLLVLAHAAVVTHQSKDPASGFACPFCCCCGASAVLALVTAAARGWGPAGLPARAVLAWTAGHGAAANDGGDNDEGSAPAVLASAFEHCLLLRVQGGCRAVRRLPAAATGGKQGTIHVVLGSGRTSNRIFGKGW